MSDENDSYCSRSWMWCFVLPMYLEWAMKVIPTAVEAGCGCFALQLYFEWAMKMILTAVELECGCFILQLYLGMSDEL